MNPLLEGEQLLWSGRPQRYVRRYRDFHNYLTIAIILIGGSGLLATRANLDFWILSGWYAVLALLLSTAFERNRDRRGFVAVTSYLVTDQRLIFVSAGECGTEYRWVPLDGLRPPRVRAHGDGTGTIDFRPTVPEWLRDQGYRTRPAWQPALPELMAVRDPDRVAELIARNGSRPPAVG